MTPKLPNLDYKIEAGDSLLGPDPSGESPREFVAFVYTCFHVLFIKRALAQVRTDAAQ